MHTLNSTLLQSILLICLSGALQSQCQQLGATACTPPPPGLIGWWPGEGNAKDLAGTNHGILINARSDSGIVGQAFNFNGPESYVRIPHTPVLDTLTNGLTLEAWVWHASTDASVQRYVTLTPDRARIQSVANRFNFSLVVTPLSTLVDLTSEMRVVPRTWFHVVGTYDGNEQRLYVNGALVASGIVNRPLPSGAASEVFISFLPGQPMNGLIDEPAIYNRALTAGEIQSHFAAGSAEMCKESLAFTRVTTVLPGGVRLRLAGRRGQTLVIQTSTNLVDWSPLATLTNETGAVQVTDDAAGGFKQRFYRAFVP